MAEDTNEQEDINKTPNPDLQRPGPDLNTEENQSTENNDNQNRNQEIVMSNYLQNIKISSSNNGLSLNDGKELKETNLLPDSKTVARFSPLWNQTLAAMAPILTTFAVGLTSGYSAILLPQLKNETDGIPSDEVTASWIASMAALPMAPGCLLSGWMMEKFGRRTSHFIISVPFLLGWILIACARNLTVMLIGRFFTGLCVGLTGPLGPVYIGETSDPKYRGLFLAGISLFLAIGILVVHIIGTFITWQWTAAICTVFPALTVVLLLFIPESPTWLISKGSLEDGAKSFCWLRGYSDEAKVELRAIIDSKKAIDANPKPSWKDKLNNFKSPELIKPLFIMIVFYVTCQFSGVNAVAFYSIEIVEKAVGANVDHYLAMISIDVVRLIMSIVACIVCKKYGRRPLCMLSGIITALSMIGLSMYLYWKPEGMVWIPLLCLIVYICAISIGLVPLPWIMCGELFPTKVRGFGSGISSSITFLSLFIVVKTAPGMMKNFGEVFTFLSYGVVAFVGTAVLYLILPETKGKSLQEIEEKFRSKKNKEPSV
ncbi:hypothetical protein K1T71_013408 [Dendrolimus kikuchii]|uniref:Uncharacterized protein n=1 Tax=Dendrolimus kikuchii TaxID=765133 RepID=A0ACC1CI04_9NEOP|nr:hypothetical protein K1T71_013408 [Dendrolimus kikuchii]